jgi:hypothetical protein
VEKATTRIIVRLIIEVNKVKLSHYCREGVKGKGRYSSYLLMTSALAEGE